MKRRVLRKLFDAKTNSQCSVSHRHTALGWSEKKFLKFFKFSEDKPAHCTLKQDTYPSASSSNLFILHAFQQMCFACFAYMFADSTHAPPLCVPNLQTGSAENVMAPIDYIIHEKLFSKKQCFTLWVGRSVYLSESS